MMAKCDQPRRSHNQIEVFLIAGLEKCRQVTTEFRHEFKQTIATKLRNASVYQPNQRFCFHLCPPQ